MLCYLLLAVVCSTWLTVSTDETYTAATLKKIIEFDELIDETVNPCDDFQKYVCSRKKEHTLTEVPPIILAVQANRVTTGVRPGDQEAVKKFYDFYEKCKAGFDKYDATLQWLLEDLDNVFKNGGSNYQPFDATLIAKLTAHLYAHHGISFFIKNNYRKPPTKSSRWYSRKEKILYFDEFDFFKDRVFYDPNVLPYKKEVLNSLFRGGVAMAFPTKSAFDVNETALKFFEFEEKLSKLLEYPKDADSVEVTVGEAMSKYPGMDWKTYITSLSSSSSVDLLKGSRLEDYPMGIFASKVVTALPKIVKMVPEETLREYIRFRVIFKYYSSINKAKDSGCLIFVIQSFSLISQHFFITEILRTPEMRSEWKNNVSKLIDDVIASGTNMLEETSWIKNDEKTYAGVKDKINKLTKVVGFPDELADQNWLDEQYKDLILDDADNLYSLYLKAMKFSAKTLFEGDTDAAVAQPDAHFDPFHNILQISIGYVYPVVYSSYYVPALNYGALGAVIGHEFMHVFGPYGMNFNGDGYYDDWMSTVSKKKLDSMAQCVVNAYDRFNVSYSQGIVKSVNGTFTLDENFCDIGGIRAAYIAFKNNPAHMQPFPKTKKLEKYTQEQLFFLAFARTSCAPPADDFIQYYYDEHAPFEIRILGTLQNFVPFREAFNCPANSVYAPEKHCEVYTPDLDSGVSALIPSFILLATTLVIL